MNQNNTSCSPFDLFIDQKLSHTHNKSFIRHESSTNLMSKPGSSLVTDEALFSMLTGSFSVDQKKLLSLRSASMRDLWQPGCGG